MEKVKLIRTFYFKSKNKHGINFIHRVWEYDDGSLIINQRAICKISAKSDDWEILRVLSDDYVFVEKEISIMKDTLHTIVYGLTKTKLL